MYGQKNNLNHKKEREKAMNILNNIFSEEEKKIIAECVGTNYIILDKFEYECFICCENGEYYYNDCFTETDNEYFMKWKFEKANPDRIIKFYNYYLMETLEEKGEWYIGKQDKNGNLEFDASGGDLENALCSL